MHTLKRLLIFTGLFTATLGAIVASSAHAQAVTRAYETDVPLQRGMIVRLSEKNADKVEAVSSKDVDKMEGVVVAANDAPVTLSSDNPVTQQVFVATTGRYNVLVSNQNGTIKKDDYITISSLSGIGMKENGKQPRVIGKALSAFDGKSNVISQTTVTDSGKNEISISIGLVAVEVDVGSNPNQETKDSIIPGLEVLQKAAGDIVDKPVAPAQLYISIVALLVTAVIAGSILYAGVRTSMTAIGRNPLAKISVMRNLLQVILTSIIILIIDITTVYLILKL